MDDLQIIGLFFKRSERAVAELSDKYGALCMSVAVNVLQNTEDAEECVNDAYMKVWEHVPPDEPKSLSAYLLRIVRNLSVNRLRDNSRDKRSANYASCIDELEELIPSSSSVEDEISEKELGAYISEYVKTLSTENRMIFVRRFFYMDSVGDVAKATGLRTGTVRTRLTRLRAGLKEYLKEKGVTV